MATFGTKGGGAPRGNKNAAGHHVGTGRVGFANKMTGGLIGGKNVDVASYRKSAITGAVLGGGLGAAAGLADRNAQKSYGGQDPGAGMVAAYGVVGAAAEASLLLAANKARRSLVKASGRKINVVSFPRATNSNSK